MRIGRRIILLALLGLMAYLLFLLASLPAAHAWSLVEGKLPAQAFGLSGTIWDGRAAAIQQGARRLDDVHWDLAPWRLLTGQLEADVQARLPGGRLRSEIALSPNAVTARQLRLEMPTPELVKWAGFKQLPVRPEGQLDALLRELSVEGQRVTHVDGLISWHNAIIRFGSAPLPLGNLALRLQPAESGTNGVLTSEGGPIDIGGTLRLNPDGRFVMDLAVQATGQVEEDTRRAMVLLGIPTDGSQVKARLSGALDGTGLRLEPIKG
jgi:general secretion pathway protein N